MKKRWKLIAARSIAGFNQREFAKAIGVNCVNLCRIERGQRTGSYDFWRKVRCALGCSAEEIEAMVDEGRS